MTKKFMVFVLSTAILLSIMPGAASANYIQAFERNTNADLTIWRYDTLADLVTGWSAPTADYSYSWGVWGTDWSMAGIAYDGNKYIQIFDHNTTGALSVWTYDTYADLVTGHSAPSATYHPMGAGVSWSANWSMTGIAYDGSKYIQVFDNNTTAALSIWTYDTLADLLLGYNAPSKTYYGVAANVWDPGGLHEWTMAGLTYDGTQYIIGFDNNTTAALSILTFSSFAGLVAGPSAQTGYYPIDASVWQPNTGPQWSMVGLAYDPVPEPATMLLLGTGLVGVAGAVRRKKKNRA